MLIPLAVNHRFDELVTSLAKLDALLKIAGNADIIDFEADTALNYFWVASDVLAKAKMACEDLARVTICSF